MIDTNGNEWKCQLKVDGIRCLIHIDNGHVTAFSRRQNDITPSLPELESISFPEEGKYILDSEVISSDGSYSSTSERIGRDRDSIREDAPNMEFKVFDLIVHDGEDISSEPFRERHIKLQSFVDSVNDDRVNLLPLNYSYSQAKKKALDNKDEGLILKRMDAPYEFDKRSSGWVKNKFDAETVDLVISGFEEGEGRLSGTLGKVELETADGVYVGDSGSGFSDEQRDEIWNNRDEWMGRTIEIEARGLGSEQKLRMPIFVRDRSEDGEPDSFERVQEIMKDV